MLKKTCKCGKLINYNEKCCSDCAVQKKEQTAYYDRYKRDKESYSFYRSKAWLDIRAVVMGRYNGLCLYSLFIDGQIVPADVVHHITEYSKDKSKALDIDNLIPLSNGVHSMLHGNYTEDAKRMLLGLLDRWKKEMN
ncbi:HNH endonuclease [Anaerotignum sp. MB30-C6]|uniref:HNH endonuclease n=1 Tax=Anaerotignum sp. MB30-C6 TaxID=3070814 RepID=UPI0027DC90B1|nr:HNH endonuclease [Anaerotignum sp. MB30-C6]WMI80915.1 HNH endonuclease [Anaerotignum sp. MB30-C6]